MSGRSASSAEGSLPKESITSQLWQLKLRTATAALIGALAAFLLTYSVHLSPFGVSPRVRPFGVAQVELLVDADPSPLADIYVFVEADDNLAANLAAAGNSPSVRRAAANAVGVSPHSIGLTEQIEQNVSRYLADSEEAQAGDTILNDARRYSVFLRVDADSFVIQVFTQAPTGSGAIRMASAVSQSLQALTRRLVKTDRVPKSSRVILRQIGPATGGDVDRDIGPEAFVALAVVFIVIAVIVMLSVTRFVQREGARRPLSVV